MTFKKLFVTANPLSKFLRVVFTLLVPCVPEQSCFSNPGIDKVLAENPELSMALERHREKNEAADGLRYSLVHLSEHFQVWNSKSFLISIPGHGHHVAPPPAHELKDCINEIYEPNEYLKELDALGWYGAKIGANRLVQSEAAAHESVACVREVDLIRVLEVDWQLLDIAFRHETKTFSIRPVLLGLNDYSSYPLSFID